MIYAVALQTRNEPEAAATVRGGLPPQMTCYLIEELQELDRWLATQLTDDNRKTLPAEGRTLGPRDFQKLAHKLIETTR